MPVINSGAFRERFSRYAFRGFVGLSAATPAIAMLQGYYLLSDFRKNHRDAPFPYMPCSGVVVVHPLPQDKLSHGALAAASDSKKSSPAYWFPSFPLLTEQMEPDPLRLLVVGDSLAAGVGVTKSGTPVLPEAIAKTLSSALGGRAVYWTCMGEPGLSSPQIVKELLLESVEISGEERQIDVMEELKDWWQERRQQQKEAFTERQQGAGSDLSRPGKIRAGWRRIRFGFKKDLQNLRDRLRIDDNIPGTALVLPRRRNTAVPGLVAEYDVAVVITGFNDLKNLVFPLPEDSQERKMATLKQERAHDEDGVSSNAWLEKDLLSIMRALRGKMRNYGSSDDNSDEITEEDARTASLEPTQVSSLVSNVPDAHPPSFHRKSRRHHPMVVFPATPLFAEKVYPLSWFAAPWVKLMEYQKKKLAEKYPAPVLFLEAPDEKVIKDFTNKRGPIWEARSKEEVLFELTNKARLEQLETLMKEYYDRWSVNVEEEEMYFCDAFGPDIQGPIQHLQHRSPLISPDRVHPSDEGYELWGRHIANAIVKEWDRVDGRGDM